MKLPIRYRLRQLPTIALGCLFVLLSFHSFAQRSDWKTRIDFLVDQIDSIAMKTQRTFSVVKYLKNDDTYKETWHYTLKDNRIVYFEIRYVIGQDEYTEIYYVDRNRPICMEQYEAPFMAYYVDELKQGGMYFIDNDAVKLYVTLGQKQKNSRDRSFSFADLNCMERFDQRFTELKNTMQYLQ